MSDEELSAVSRIKSRTPGREQLHSDEQTLPHV
jgi:hypothetical protein